MSNSVPGHVARYAPWAFVMVLSACGYGADPFTGWNVTGTVFGPDGPLEGVQLSVGHAAFTEWRVDGRGVSDANGQFVIVSFPAACTVGPGDFFGLRATHPRYEMDRHEGFSGSCPWSDFDDVRVYMVPSLSIGNATVTEGDAGTVSASFAVTLSTPSSATVTVNYATDDGTATAPICGIRRPKFEKHGYDGPCSPATGTQENALGYDDSIVDPEESAKGSHSAAIPLGRGIAELAIAL